MDIAPTTAPKSDQQNFDDYVSGPKTVTVAEVTPGTVEQPVEVHLVEFPGRPYKPSKSMRRVLIAGWGSDSTPWAGRRMTLAGDPTVKFGGATVGGIKIAALSHLEKRLTVQLTVTRGKRAPHVVEPLADTPALSDPGAPMFAALSAAGFTDKDGILAEVASVIGRTPASSTDMTGAERQAVIDHLATKDGA